ncbi:hypothetical protein HA402_004644 [Bradysia odoriphaga]|nr:hypothetical protein HA402_004644 [Bradysia odoriphaga]
MVRSNPSVEAFLGVPYATPPVGSLRFMPPVTPSTWRNTRLADRFSPVCPQVPPVSGDDALFDIPRGRLAQLRRILPLLANQSEDCLYLNLYVPRSDETNEIIENSMATIVYVHGESYEWNSGSIYDGSILAAHGNVIVVTINFRLGVLGFLKTGAKGSAQGNFGLMDLVAGLHWLRENLPAFNGDPSKVVLMGHGTGASLANILMVSPVASDLINRAILISGSALSPWAIQKDPLYVKRKVAEGTGCHGDLLDDDMAPCLRTKPLADLLSVTIDSPRFLPGFAPFVDGTVIVNPATSATPLTLPAGSAIASTAGIELADFPTKELLFGLTSMESYLDLSAQDLEFGFNETRRDRILRTYVRNVYHYHLNEIYSALKNEYTDWERPPRNPMGSRDASLELLSDGHTAGTDCMELFYQNVFGFKCSIFAAPLVRLGYLHSLRGGRSYFLHFRHQSGERDFPQRGGSVRGEDVPFCLGLPISPLFPYNYTKQDIKISRILVQYLANFAQTGNPNGISSSTSSADTSRPFTHNHIATPIGDHSKLTVTMTDNNKNSIDSGLKQKRQTNFRRNKRNHHELVQDVDSSESDEVDENDDDELVESAEEQPNHLDRLDDIANLRIPFWDTYDSINQLYLEMGNNIEIRNHYRGHKLSMWLSLIPQLHSPGDIAELSMRHHHFLEESAQYYDGIVRPQNLQRPSLPKVISPPPPPPTTTTATQAPKTEQTSVTSVQSTTTECPPNTTIVPTLAATRPQQNQGTNSITTNNNLLRRLANTQYPSYTTALTLTVAVGCFLLLLNILIFAGIYYQREKRATDAKKKEELTEAEIRCSPSINHDKCGKSSRKSSLQSVSGFNPVPNFGEYSCYDEKIQCKEKHNLADICSVELPLQEFKCANGSESNTSSLRRSMKSDSYKHNLNNLMHYPPTYSSPHPSEPGSSTSNGLVMYTQFNRTASSTTEQCNQSTQSDIPDVQDVGTGVMQTDVDDNNSGECSPGIPEPPPPPRSAAPYQGGILRQQGGPSTPAASKKRVQIQEISV